MFADRRRLCRFASSSVTFEEFLETGIFLSLYTHKKTYTSDDVPIRSSDAILKTDFNPS